MNKLKTNYSMKCKFTKTIGKDCVNNFQLINEKLCYVDNEAETFELQEIKE